MLNDLPRGFFLNPVNTYVPKVWGYELWFQNSEKYNYCAKLLHINSGQSLSLHFHVDKAETLIPINNDVEVHVYDTVGNQLNSFRLSKNCALEILPGAPHSFQALYGDVDLFEASTFHRDEDSYRVGRVG